MAVKGCSGRNSVLSTSGDRLFSIKKSLNISRPYMQEMDHPTDTFREKFSLSSRSSLLANGFSKSANVSDDENSSEENLTSFQEQEQPEETCSKESLSSVNMWTLGVIGLGKFTVNSCFSLIGPLFPDVAIAKGVSPAIIGLIFSSFPLCVFISAPIFGSHITHIGSKFLNVAGQFLCGAASILFGFLNLYEPGNVFIASCFAIRMVMAVGASAESTASFAIIAGQFPKRVATIAGALETCSGLGFIAGPLIAGVFREIGGFGLPFWFVGILLILSTVLSAFCLPSSQDGDYCQNSERSALSLMANPPVVMAVTYVAVACCSMSFLDSVLAQHLQSFYLRPVFVGLTFMVVELMYIPSALFWGWLADKKNLIFSSMTFGNVLACVSFLLLGPSPLVTFVNKNVWLIILSLGMFGFGFGAIIVPSVKCIMREAKNKGFRDGLELSGITSGVYCASLSLGLFLGPIVGNIVMQNTNFPWAATLTASFHLFSVLIMSVYFTANWILSKRRLARTNNNQKGYQQLH